MSFLEQLATAGSKAILTPPLVSERSVLADVGFGDVLFDVLGKKNGFYAFDDALHVFPLGGKTGVLDLERWNSESLWRSEYQDATTGYFFFAEDVFGVQFCIRGRTIFTFDPETGSATEVASSLEDWAKFVLENPDVNTGRALARLWQEANGPMLPGMRLVPKIPFVMQGSYAVENLYQIDAVDGMRFRASIARQVRDLPDGAKVKLRVV